MMSVCSVSTKIQVSLSQKSCHVRPPVLFVGLQRSNHQCFIFIIQISLNIDGNTKGHLFPFIQFISTSTESDFVSRTSPLMSIAMQKYQICSIPSTETNCLALSVNTYNKKKKHLILIFFLPIFGVLYTQLCCRRLALSKDKESLQISILPQLHTTVYVFF